MLSGRGGEWRNETAVERAGGTTGPPERLRGIEGARDKERERERERESGGGGSFFDNEWLLSGQTAAGV
jgi:hypothetical protein